MTSALLALGGVVAVVAGVAMLSLPAAFIVGGLLAVVGGILLYDPQGASE